MSEERCTTHHHACDCREEKIKRLVQAARKAREMLNELKVYEMDEYEELKTALEAFVGEYESPEGQEGG